MRFMLLHDNLRATDDAIKLFFMEVYELFIKVLYIHVRIIVHCCVTCVRPVIPNL